MKQRVTLTIDEDLLKQIDSNIDGHNIKNRSHAVELLLVRALGSRKPTTALILAGGRDDSLREVIGDIPKCLAVIRGKSLLEHTVLLFKRFGINDIMISIRADSHEIKSAIGDGERFGLNIIYIEEEYPLGTAGPLKMAREFINTTFFMSNADELKDIDLTDMYTFHSEHKGLVTIALKTVSDPSRYGVANMTGRQIVSFIEKPNRDNAPSNLVNAGIYIIEPEVIDLIPEGFATLENDLFPKLAAQQKLYGYAFSGKWIGISSVEDYKRAQEIWTDE